ncbi:MAG: type 4a pilus biogenesis protein PilO [Myxococcales bacterium]|nr:type 4a pilus biogenesis protein PilO [Myxococcales bacterium]
MIDKFMKIPLNQRLGLLALAMTVIALIFYFFAYSATKDETAKIKGQNTQLSLRVRELKQNSDKFNPLKVKKENEELEKKLSMIKKMLPSSEESDTFIASIEGDAKTSQLVIENTQRLERKYEANFARLPIRTEVKGTFIALISFLRKLSDRAVRQGQMKRIVNVDQIDIAPSGSDTIDGKRVSILKSRFVSNTYMLVDGSRRRK